MANIKPTIAITHGDINGIGYEVILKTFEDERIAELCTPVLFGSSKILAHYRKMLELPTRYNVVRTLDEIQPGVLNVIDCIDETIQAEPGTSSTVAGQAALASLEAAVDAVVSGKLDVLVTAPINKKNIQSETFTFPGHTEFLEHVCGSTTPALMVLTTEGLRVALVTTHMPLSEVASALTEEGVIEKIRIFNQTLRRDFGIHHPRIAVLSLNPHAGEEGLLGTEEQEIIIPAIRRARDEKIMAFGPYASDGFFGSGRFVKFDGVMAMYHDQGLTPFKVMAMDTGVNFTAGLPLVRTSPDHGTGYDIVGRGEASPDSMRQAIYEAIDILRNRRREDEATANPLMRQTPERPERNKDKQLSAEKTETVTESETE